MPGTTFGHENAYSIEITVTLQDHPTITTTATFTATVSPCEVSTLTPTTIASQYYDVYTPLIQFSHIDFVQSPDCLYTLSYTYELLDTGTGSLTALPSFITESSKVITVVTNDPNDVDSYKI